jgi:hypothetical protein
MMAHTKSVSYLISLVVLLVTKVEVLGVHLLIFFVYCLKKTNFVFFIGEQLKSTEKLKKCNSTDKKLVCMKNFNCFLTCLSKEKTASSEYKNSSLRS